ncbi:40S ribosomal protein S12 [Coemansia sp. RSA 2523]|nr:40S ribosomal protein S12 [Coemansia sp. RSA 1591]KAJ1760025.1 40S ribosomal protein S12 [Coemansia sp. RSA 1824]KAJ1763872.1 40S ribosomal protein S12 [Coemansia sp. RSA 1752]KAJ1790354.1 40S ribosomal protein S12 [Coemansia sp. RSA 1938]KAJ1793716.1 40S ribosomal protein S12 [Coemansia sp. RSA 2167]KAJ1800179.1 40S ribosomal protein S12 [Coemansia sp. RSA 2523]KAJ2131971.1 40S ribosomal protein S12 [Coemansia sp. RSA 921]KAJ2134875.1 40S ribosomal protein S12 [Coemansia sp. RSA 788]KAJ
MASEGDAVAASVPETQPTIEVAADAVTGTLTIEEALEIVLKKALVNDGLVRGAKESIKALDRKDAELCVLSESTEEAGVVALVEALCAEHSIRVIKVPTSKMLGEMAGLCKIDREGNARKVVGASVVVVRKWGEESVARTTLLEHFGA